MNAPAEARGSAVSRQKGAALSAARLFAVQALYQIAMSGASMDSVLEEFLRHRLRDADDTVDVPEAVKPKAELFSELVRGAIRRREEINDMIAAVLPENWSLDRLESVLRCILEAGVYELLARRRTPARVVINEYVDLTHAFYAGAEPGMVNGILDRLARKVRPAEFGIDTGE